MASLGKKILPAFVEVNDNKKPEAEIQSVPLHINSYGSTGNSKFKDHFNKLFKEANIPGPHYFEFSKMIEAWSSIKSEPFSSCCIILTL
jgi:hypothetical protein